MATWLQNGRITPASIPLGLLSLDRKSIATFLAIFEDSSAISLITDQLGNLGDSAYSKYSEWKDGTSTISQERFTGRVIQTASNIEVCSLSDNGLRFALWAHIREAFGLQPRIAISPRDLDYCANDIGAAISVSVAQKRIAEEKAALSKKELAYWKHLAKEANPFGSRDIETVPFDEAVREAVFALLGATISNEDTPDSEKQDLISQIRSELSNLNQSVLKEANLETLSDDAIQKVLVSSGGLLGLMGAVEAAGFGAYILAAQASAIIPLIGGKTLVSALFVMSHPLFVLPVIFAMGGMQANFLTKTVRRAFAVSVGSLLAVRGLDSGLSQKIGAARMFFDASGSAHQNEVNTSQISLPSADEYRDLSLALSSGLKLPVANEKTDLLISQLDQPVEAIKKEQFIEGFLFSDQGSKEETLLLAGLSLCDFIFDLSAIDSKVLEAADFSHTADLGDPFLFAEFAERITSLSTAAIQGHEVNLLGYTAERIVASRLIDSGYLVSIPESASQPGYDLLVDGLEFQVKCIAPKNFQILERHFEKYPDTPVIANSEIAETIADRSPDWASQVFFVEGYSYEFTDGLVETAIKAGTEIGDYELVPLIATMSVIKNAHGWWIGQHSMKEASFNVAVESAAKGVMAVAGGFVGQGIGALMFGPAGAYVFGGVVAVAATTESHWISDKIDTVIDPDRDEKLSAAACKLLQTCIEHLEAKVLGIEVKAKSLPENKISDAMRYRWMWEIVFTKSKINEARLISDNASLSGERRAINGLEFASRCGVHPVWLQDDYTAMLGLLKQPKNRWDKALNKFSDFIRGR
jgi:hypothetical protein